MSRHWRNLLTDTSHNDPTSGVARVVTLAEVRSIKGLLLDLFRRHRVGIAADDMLLIGTAALHVSGIRLRPTDDVDFLVRELTPPQLRERMHPLLVSDDCIARRYADHVYGISIGTSPECDMLISNERGVHACVVDLLFEGAANFDDLKCATPGDILALKVVALVDRLARGDRSGRVAKYRGDVKGLLETLSGRLDMNRLRSILHGYGASRTARALEMLAML